MVARRWIRHDLAHLYRVCIVNVVWQHFGDCHFVRIPKGLAMSDPILGTFHNAETGETITRELTPEEIAALPEPTESPE